MKDIKEFYILGEPIETEVGLCSFIKVREYPDFFFDLQTIALNKANIIYSYQKINKNGQLNEIVELLYKLSLYEIIRELPELNDSYVRVFSKVFGSADNLHLINAETFNYYRQLIMDMNNIKEEKVNPNPEIQRAIERSRRVKQHEGDKLEFSDIVTSIVGFNGLTYKDVNEMTLYQLYMTFQRIAQIKGYDTSTLFATVSADKVQIDSWCKHISLNFEEQHSISHDEFKRTTGNVISE